MVLALGRVDGAQVSFEQDVELSQMNEYEILQIIMGDCREKLQSYTYSYEEDVKLSQVRSVCLGVALRQPGKGKGRRTSSWHTLV